MNNMRIKTSTIIGLGLCAMLMLQGSGGSEDAGASDTDQVTRQPARSGSHVPRGMVLIPGGTISGTNPLAEGERYSDWYPATYNITVDDFLMDIHLVTKRLWDWVRDDPATVFRGYEMGPGSGKAANHPVHTVNWFDAVKWLNARSELTGRDPVYYLDAAYTQIFRSGSGGPRDEYWEVYVKAAADGYRLPTRDQWEYAARGGLQSKRFPWGDEINHDHANYRANGSDYSYDNSPHSTYTYHPKHNDGRRPYTAPVGSFAANGYGLHDMIGNMTQWCLNWYRSSNPSRELRGGSWTVNADYCRIAHRGTASDPCSAHSNYGLRAVMSPDQASPVPTGEAVADMKVTVYYSDGQTPYGGATVKLDSWDGQLEQWTERLSDMTDARSGSVTFLKWPATLPGEKYRLRILNGLHTLTEVHENMTLADTDAGSSYSVTTSQVPPPDPEVLPGGMVLIPGGTNAGTDPDSGAYSLMVDSFYMARHEVTKALWDEVHHWAVTHGGYSFDNVGSGKAANHPVHTVNWYDVVKWCNARSEKEGRPAVYIVNGAVYKTGQSIDVVQTNAAGYRLPTDMEREYAARGGLSGRRFPWGDVINHDHANYTANSSKYSYDITLYSTRTHHPEYDDGVLPYTSPVGSFAANGYGLYDMSGNMWEWCFDWLPEYEGRVRVVRGGSWHRHADSCRVGYRRSSTLDRATDTIGFRSVLPSGPADTP